MTPTYKVYIDDNFHYMDESERIFHGLYTTCESAISECEQIVDDCLKNSYKKDMTAIQLYESFIGFGDDPFILSDDKTCDFDSSAYAKMQSVKIVQENS